MFWSMLACRAVPGGCLWRWPQEAWLSWPGGWADQEPQVELN